MKRQGRRKYLVLFLGYTLAWGTYFGIRTFQLIGKDFAYGDVRAITWGHFAIGNPRRAGDYKGSYPCPEIHFPYKASATDTSTEYTVWPESLALDEWKPGDKIEVMFPKGHPENAIIYSPGEFWFTPPYMVILLVITGFWSAGFFIVVFKPWKQSDIDGNQ